MLAGCTDCGYNAHHAGLEFDHVPERGTKVASPSSPERFGYDWDRMKEEIAKCDVVCGTCHNIRTFERRYGL